MHVYGPGEGLRLPANLLTLLVLALWVLPVAALVATCVAGPSIFGHLTPGLLLIGLGIAILLQVAPFILELLALRRLTTGAFGTLMSLEPAIAMVIGLVVLHQVPWFGAVLGMGLVVAAGIGSARGNVGVGSARGSERVPELRGERHHGASGRR